MSNTLDTSPKKSTKARLIAFYLPQFHPIPENDEWWGKGFTEWTNVAKARPLFRGHCQPNIPADLGFYDLRLSETREAQAQLARETGIEGFCYWHYWFSGKRILERPFTEVLKSGKPEYPFCLAWANATWTGIWYDCPDRILIKQEYLGGKDYENHFLTILDAFHDDRYMTVDGKPIFFIFRPQDIPDPALFIDTWQELAIKNGLKGIYFIGFNGLGWKPMDAGFDKCCVDFFTTVRNRIDRTIGGKIPNFLRSYSKKISWKNNRELKPKIYSYKNIVKYAFDHGVFKDYQLPCVIPNWDNTPRSGGNGVVFTNATPELFRTHLRQAVRLMDGRDAEKKIIFLKSWNEWAEGNYVEPDFKFGHNYLNVIRDEIVNIDS